MKMEDSPNKTNENLSGNVFFVAVAIGRFFHDGQSRLMSAEIIVGHCL